jgi:phosphoribosylformimino-5-aminoimidazole carboxamide ribonucleotide (ProFAR) isomerase
LVLLFSNNGDEVVEVGGGVRSLSVAELVLRVGAGAELMCVVGAAVREVAHATRVD